jgi:hypothetical protein
MRYTVLRKRTGEVMIIDNVRLRLFHLRRRIFAWAKVTEKLARSKGVHMSMYGLSYDTAGTLVKPSLWAVGDIREFMMRLKARMGKRLLAYAWVAELQKRGVIHYHVIIIYKGRAPMPDKAYKARDELGHYRYFKRMWWKGNSHSDFDVRSPYYLADYVRKEYQKDFEHFPIGAHAWAVWISDEALKTTLRFESLDKYKQELITQSMLEDDGVGFEEAWEKMEWEVKRTRLAHKMVGDSWEYLGQITDASGVAKWGITDELLKKKIFTRWAVGELSVSG